MLPLKESLEAYLNRFIDAYQKKLGHLPKVEKDPLWPSPCERGDVENTNETYWNFVAIEEDLSFNNVEQALNLKLHPSISEFFCSFYSEHVPARTDKGKLELLLTWNHDDFERLQQNIIGHLIMKQKLKQPPTVFFAVTDEEDWFLSIDNQSGKVMLESPGIEPTNVIANSLGEFLNDLQPPDIEEKTT